MSVWCQMPSSNRNKKGHLLEHVQVCALLTQNVKRLSLYKHSQVPIAAASLQTLMLSKSVGSPALVITL